MVQAALLVVEDDALVTWALKRAALSLKIPVHVAASRAEAIEAVRAHAFGLAFVDIHLPDGNGLDLVPEIRAASPDAKIVVMTSDATPANQERACRCGAWHFLEKPFDLEEATRVIRQCLSIHGEQRAFPRRFCRVLLRVELVADGDDALRPRFEGSAVDVSEGGLQLHTPYPLEPGQQLRVHPLPSEVQPATCVRRDATARVVWTRKSGAGVVAGLAYD